MSRWAESRQQPPSNIMQAAELPWREPSRGLDLSGLNLGNLSKTVDDLAEDFKVHSCNRSTLILPSD